MWNSAVKDQILKKLICDRGQQPRTLYSSLLTRFRPLKQKEIEAENFNLRSCILSYDSARKPVLRNFNQLQNRSEISAILWLVEKDFRSFFFIRVDWCFLWHYSYFSDIEFILLHLLWQLIHWLGVFETPMGVWEQIGVSWSRLFHPFLIHPVTKSIN